MYRILYLTSSSYSGSTLFTFLVNQHPSIFSIGELEGWDYGDREFKCSCGDIIEECEFFRNMAKEFQKNSLPFKTNDFGTRLTLSTNPRLNRYLTSALPLISNTFIEKARDYVLSLLPIYRKRYEIAKRSNVTFVNKSLEYSGATVFLDATKNPYRLRFFNMIPEFDLNILYMIRDFRGVVASNIRKKNVDAKFAMSQWIREQETILRIIQEYPNTEKLFYEDLCSNTNTSLSKIYNIMGLTESPFEGNFREGDHHILGNTMRISDVDEISLDQRWKSELSMKQLNEITDIARRYLKTGKNPQLKEIIMWYLDTSN